MTGGSSGAGFAYDSSSMIEALTVAGEFSQARLAEALAQIRMEGADGARSQSPGPGG